MDKLLRASEAKPGSPLGQQVEVWFGATHKSLMVRLARGIPNPSPLCVWSRRPGHLTHASHVCCCGVVCHPSHPTEPDKEARDGRGLARPTERVIPSGRALRHPCATHEPFPPLLSLMVAQSSDRSPPITLPIVLPSHGPLLTPGTRQQAHPHGPARHAVPGPRRPLCVHRRQGPVVEVHRVPGQPVRWSWCWVWAIFRPPYSAALRLCAGSRSRPMRPIKNQTEKSPVVVYLYDSI